MSICPLLIGLFICCFQCFILQHLVLVSWMKYLPFVSKGLFGCSQFSSAPCVISASSELPFFCLLALICSLLYSRHSSNIWGFIHVKEWGTKVLTGSCVKSGGKAESWFFHVGLVPTVSVYVSVLMCLSTQFPQTNLPTLGWGTVSRLSGFWEWPGGEGAACLSLALPLAGSHHQFLLSAK